jgi:hypothetical protein
MALCDDSDEPLGCISAEILLIAERKPYHCWTTSSEEYLRNPDNTLK